MFNLFTESDVINNLKTIVKSMEENMTNKIIISLYYKQTGLIPKQCDCEKGTKRLQCKKCNGLGYVLEKSDK